MNRLLSYILVCVLILTCAVPALAGELEELNKRNQEISTGINNAQWQKKQKENEKSYLEQIEQELEEREKRAELKADLLSVDADSLAKAVQEIDNFLDEYERQYREELEKLKVRLGVIYEFSSMSVLDVLLQSKNIIDFFERIEYLTAITKKDKELLEKLEKMKRDIEYKKQIKEEERLYFEYLMREQNEKVKEIEASRADVDNKIRQTTQDIIRLEYKIDELNAEAERMTQRIKALQSQKSYAGGIMEWPVPSCHTVVSPYGMRMHPILGKYKMHTGIDIDGANKASIVAANNGTVIYAGWMSGYGYTVVIDHGGGISTLYAHCSQLLVRDSQVVKKGETIAKIGSTGLSTGPHLHFEVREDGQHVNPLEKYLTEKK